MDNQHQVHRRHNFPAELKVEIVDCFPLENAVHFLENVPNRLIIHHCAPRIRRILKMIDQIVIAYVSTLPAANTIGLIWLQNGHHYTPEMDIFLRNGAAHCALFAIFRGSRDGFVGYYANFFDNLIKHYYEMKVPAKAIHHLAIELPLENPAPWPAAQPGQMILEESKVDNAEKWVEYILRNNHNPGIAFEVRIYFQGEAKCYQQMTAFVIWHVEDVKSREA